MQTGNEGQNVVPGRGSSRGDTRHNVNILGRRKYRLVLYTHPSSLFYIYVVSLFVIRNPFFLLYPLGIRLLLGEIF